MAEINIPGLFDTQINMKRQSIEDARAMAAIGDPARNLMTYNTMRSGDIYNQGLMGLAQLMGGSPSPEMSKQQALEEVFQQFGNPETPEDAMAISDALRQRKLYNEAMKFADFANEMRKSMPKPVKPTADIQNFNKAVDEGFEGSFFEYQKALKSGSKQVSIGSIPQDFIVVTNDAGEITMEVIPGSPTDIANKKDKQAKAEGDEVRGTQKSIVVEDIDRLKTKITEAPWYNPVAGSIIGKFMENPYIGSGGNRIDGEALATTIKSSIGFDRLQQMRDESPTGGALGQVSELELITLQATLGSLDLNQSEEQLLDNLDRLAIVYQDMLKKIAETGDGTFEEKMGGSSSTSPTGSAVFDNDPFKIRIK